MVPSNYIASIFTGQAPPEQAFSAYIEAIGLNPQKIGQMRRLVTETQKKIYGAEKKIYDLAIQFSRCQSDELGFRLLGALRDYHLLTNREARQQTLDKIKTFLSESFSNAESGDVEGNALVISNAIYYRDSKKASEEMQKTAQIDSQGKATLDGQKLVGIGLKEAERIKREKRF